MHCDIEKLNKVMEEQDRLLDRLRDRLSEQVTCKAPKLELDETPSGKVEVIKGPDGKYRRYCRMVDHDEIVNRVIDACEGKAK